ncbi:MAG: hypothetical protein LBF71_04730 [Campylobacteraceae bacterium]|jgi:hypothetical protein|nr:hypothetical protein [Campylobacteraceae bacterium]
MQKLCKSIILKTLLRGYERHKFVKYNLKAEQNSIELKKTQTLLSKLIKNAESYFISIAACIIFRIITAIAK